MVDFRHVADYFFLYGYTPLTTQASVERVKGVGMNCLGDMKMLKRPQFETVDMPTTDAIFTDHDTSDIAERIGIPIFDTTLPTRSEVGQQQAWDVQTHVSYPESVRNIPAPVLQPPSQIRCGHWIVGLGWCPMAWQNDVGSIIVLRKDTKPLLPIPMEAIARYCRYEVRPILAHSIGEYYPEEPIKKDDVLTIICRPMFVVYWAEFREERQDYASPDPYDNGD